MIFKNKNSLLLSKTITQRVQKPPEVEIEPGTFGFVKGKYKCPGFDPHVWRFFRTLLVIVF